MRFWKILTGSESHWGLCAPPSNAVETLKEAELECPGDTASKAAGDVLPAARRSRIYAAWTVFSLTLNSSIFIHGIFNVQLREPLRELSDAEHHGLPYGKAKKTTLIKWNTEILLLLSILFQVGPKCCIPHWATPATQKLSLEKPVGAKFSEQAFLRQKSVSITPLRLQVAPLKQDWLPFYPVV